MAAATMSITDMPEPTTTPFDWKAAVKRKRQENADKTPQEWLLSTDYIESLNSGPTKRANLIELEAVKRSGILNTKELEITESYTAFELLEKLRTAHFSAAEVTTAFCKRAAVGQQLLSCLTEVFYSDAIEQAKSLDEYLEREGRVIGPLHGLPISIKDSFCLKGIQSTVGYTSFLAKSPSQHESPLVQMLRQMGAVLYVKTNIPQTMMTGDSENNIFGRTLNPHNTSLTAGGSSGGEGSLVAFRGSILGVGTDIAGSIRIPALCCGVYGFKPTANRVPFGGQVSGAMEGLPGLIPSAGPLAHNLDDVELFLRTILSSPTDAYDSTAIAAPWRSVQLSSRLRIGVLPEEKVFPLHPPIRRAFKVAMESLTAAGHELVELPSDPSLSVSLANRLAFSYYILGPDKSGEHFGPDGEPMVASVAARYHPMFSGPFPVEKYLELDPFEKINQLHIARKMYHEAWQKEWLASNIDIILAPAAQNTAVPHDTYGWPPYTQIWNVLDYPACVIPYGKADKTLDPEASLEDEFGPQPKYDAEAVHGAPCAVQVVGRRFRDEECLAAAKIIDSVLQGIS